MGRETLLLLTNGRARWGHAGDEAAERLRGLGFAVIHRTPLSPEGMQTALRREGPAADLVALGGGDGTLSAALPALLEIGKPLCVLPLGTANDLAASLGLPHGIEACADLARYGVRRRIDLGRINGRPYFNAASLGLGARVAAGHGGKRKRRFGVLNYLLVLAEVWRNFRPIKARIDVEGEVIEGHFLHIAAVNGRYHGGWITAHDAATLEDGRIDLYAVRPVSLLRLASLLPALRTGRPAGADIVRRRGRRIAIETRRRHHVNVDGELSRIRSLAIDLLPQALEVLVPSGEEKESA